jgi:NAD(P)-dependent dehydrogenase (short-subunit alcohol dehydrogenase family)
MDYPPVSNLLDFSGKVVLVTGAAVRIGAGIVMRFFEAGADVVVHYHSSEESAEEIKKEIVKRGRKALVIKADLTQQSEVEGLMKAIVKEYGRLDVLINNAGAYPGTPLIEMQAEDWQYVLDVNLTSVFLCTNAAAQQMIRQGSGGAVVNISSIESQNPASGHAHYCAAKAGLDQFSRTAALELGQYGIRVNVVSPGLIWCEGLEQRWPDGVQRFLKAAPLKRLGMPPDVADACLFLASPAARWITGANLVVDGGVLTTQAY